MGAGLLPRRVTGRAEIAMLVGYGVVAAYAFGLLMNLVRLAVHPRHRGPRPRGRLSFVAGRPVLENLQRFLRLHAAHLDRRLGHRPRDHQRGSRSSCSARRS